MSKFKITAYPAKRGDISTGIIITHPITRTEVECKLDELPKHLEQAAQVASPMTDHPDVHVTAYPIGRAPNGFNAFKAARRNEFTRIAE